MRTKFLFSLSIAALLLAACGVANEMPQPLDEELIATALAQTQTEQATTQLTVIYQKNSHIIHTKISRQ